MTASRSAGLVAAALAALCAAARAAAPARSVAGNPPVTSTRLAASTSSPALAVAPLTGRDRVGTIALPVFDPSRRRELMIQIWYPT